MTLNAILISWREADLTDWADVVAGKYDQVIDLALRELFPPEDFWMSAESPEAKSG